MADDDLTDEIARVESELDAAGYNVDWN